MVDQHDQHAAILQRGVEVDQRCAGVGELDRQGGGIGFDHTDAIAEPARQRRRDIARRAFAEIVDVGLERQAQAGDLLARMRFQQRGGLGDHVVHLAVVDQPRGADQRRLLGRSVDNEPRVHRDAVAAHAGAGLQDVHARMPVGQPDHFPHVQPHLVRHHRQFVGEGDVDVAIGVLDQLGHLGRTRVRGHAGAAHEALVEGQRLARAARGDAADRTVVVGEFLQNAARQHAFGAVGDRNVGRLAREARKFEVRAQAGHQVAHLLGRAHRRGGFEDDRIARLQHGGHFGRRRQHIGDVRRVVLVLFKRRGHRDHENVGRLDPGGGAQQAALDHAMHQPVEIDFLDMDFAAVDRFDHAVGHVEAQHAAARARDDRGGGQADISQSDDTDVGLHFTGFEVTGLVRHVPKAPRCGAMSAHPRTGCGHAPWPNRQPYRRAG